MLQKVKQNCQTLLETLKNLLQKKIIDWILNSKVESRKEWMQVVLKYNAKYKSNNETYQVWQRGNMPKAMLHPKFIFQKINYIHSNPVVSEIVSQPEDYIYSSARNYIGREDFLINVELVDFGAQEGFVFS